MQTYNEYQTLSILEQDFERIFNDTNKIIIGKDIIPVSLVEYLLKDDLSFKNLYEIFKKRSKVTIISTDEESESYDFNKIAIIEAIEIAQNKGFLKLTGTIANRYKLLLELISYNNLKRSTKNKILRLHVEKKEYLMPVAKILEFLELSYEEMQEYLSAPNQKDVIPKEIFLYLVRKYIVINDLDQNFILPPEVETKIDKILNYELLDFEAVNTYLSDENSLADKTVISEELEEAILKEIPEDYSSLEKAIYIYIKMCKILSYNDEFFAAKQRGLAAEKHRYIDYIEVITPNYPEVVCFEFNAIYAKMLHKLGINFERQCFNWKNKYGDGHENLSFRVGKFIIEADSSKRILTGDLFNAKIGSDIKGLKCLNQNFDTYLEFEEILRKVYRDIKKENKSEFSKALKEYEEITNARKFNLPFAERFELYLEKIRATAFTGINLMSYIVRLTNTLFTPDEKERLIDFEIIRDNKPKDPDKIVGTCGIITMNEKGIFKDEEHNKYYIYIDGQLKRIPKRTLKRLITTNNLNFIDEEEQYIPGIR